MGAIYLLMIMLGIGVDAFYQRLIRIAECDAYETGYQQGIKEGRIREEARNPQVMAVGADGKHPSMDAPIKMPDDFAEHMRKHGRAVVKLK